jgi:integrase
LRTSCLFQRLRFRDPSGITRLSRIGRTSVISLAEARKEAKARKARLTLGEDLHEKSQAKKAIPLYSEFFEKTYLPYVTLRKRSWKRDKQHYELRIKPAIGHLKLDQIDRKCIQAMHSEALEEGLAASSANGTIRILRHSMNLAIQWQLYPGPNPAARIPLFHEDNKVNNLLSDEQLDGLLKVLRTDKNRMVCGIILFLMATGARLSEALTAQWSDIDLEKRSFVIRATNSKSKKLRAVPLNDTAMEVLLALPTRDTHEYVFVNKQTDRPYTTIAKQWDRIRKQAKVPFFRIHDARHTYAALLASSGVSLWTISTLLGHSDPKITTRYAHLTTKALESASNVAALKLSGQKHSGKEGRAGAQ